MSDLKDLATTLEENHWQVEIKDDELIAVRPHTKTEMSIFGSILIDGVLIKADGDNVSLFPSDLKILSDYFGPDDDEDAIRAHQQSPAPSGPSAADAVTISQIVRDCRERHWEITDQTVNWDDRPSDCKGYITTMERSQVYGKGDDWLRRAYAAALATDGRS